MPDKRKLTSTEEIRVALERARAALHGTGMEVCCPLCGAPGLAVVDRSARPHTEWYALTCAACGLDDAIAIPLCLQMSGG